MERKEMDKKRTEQLIRDTRYKISQTISSAKKSQILLSDMVHGYFVNDGYIFDGYEEAKCRCEIAEHYMREAQENLKEMYKWLEEYKSLSEETPKSGTAKLPM